MNDSHTKLPMVKYVDDVTMSEEGAYPKPEMDGMVSTITTNLQEDADVCFKKSKENYMGLNTKQTLKLLVSFYKNPPEIPPIKINGESIRRVNSAKLLCITVSSDLTCGNRGNDIYIRAA